MANNRFSLIMNRFYGFRSCGLTYHPCDIAIVLYGAIVLYLCNTDLAELNSLEILFDKVLEFRSDSLDFYFFCDVGVKYLKWSKLEELAVKS